MSKTLEQWLEGLADAREKEVDHVSTFSRGLTLSAVVARPVVANSRLVGTDATAALTADAEYVSIRNSGNSEAAQEKLATSPVTGCAMIMSLAQSASGYNPAAPSADGNLAGFLAYVQQLIQCPAFNVETNDRINIDWSTDWGTIVNNITAYYVGIPEDDLATIRNSLWTIANAAASSPNTNESDNLFVQSTINASGAIHVYIYKSFVLMRRDVSKGSGKNAPTISKNQAHFELYRTVLNLDTGKWPQYSRVIMPKTNASLSSWLEDNSTPKGKVPVNWDC
jgi:hypothetical protein